MCTRVTCRTCGKATYSGCGLHVESVLRGVPAHERCRCEPRASEGFLSALLGLGRPPGQKK